MNKIKKLSINIHSSPTAEPTALEVSFSLNGKQISGIFTSA
jgi:hypothetical protein